MNGKNNNDIRVKYILSLARERGESFASIFEVAMK